MTIAQRIPFLRPGLHAGVVMFVLIGMGAVRSQGVLYAQDNWYPILVACQSATGAGSAEENLVRLKSQNPATPEITAAIAKCEVKATTLRQAEQQVWVQALETKKNWDCTDSRRLFKTLVDKASLYQPQASIELKRLGDCGEQILTEETPDQLLQHAKTAYKSREFRLAREQSWRIVGQKNSIGEEARKLIKDIEEIEIVNELLRRVDRSFRSNRVHDACSALLGIQETHPTFPNMAEVKIKLNECPTTSTDTAVAATPKTEREKQLQAVKTNIDEGNLELANLRLSAAAKTAPIDKSIAQMQEFLQAAKHARDLLDLGVNLIYQAKYPEALTQLASIITGQTSSGLVARAHFYMGVAMAHEFYLRGDKSAKAKALQEFQSSATDFMKPDFDQISPKIKQLYDQAIGN